MYFVYVYSMYVSPLSLSPTLVSWYVQFEAGNTCNKLYIYLATVVVVVHHFSSESTPAQIHPSHNLSLPLPVGVEPLVVVLLLSALEVQLLVCPFFQLIVHVHMVWGAHI